VASNVSVTYNFVAGTDAVADQVDTNFNDVVSWVNTNAAHLDGSKAFTGIPSGPSSNPTTANQLARKAYVDGVAGIPIGGVAMWAGTTAPTGYLLCRGQAVNRGDYVDLYTTIGDTYGAGNGTTTFNVPNLQGRVPVGLDSGQTEFDALAETGGAKTVALIEANLPAHAHAIDHDHGSHTLTIADNTQDLVTRLAAFVDGGFGSGVVDTDLSPVGLTMTSGLVWPPAGMAQNYITEHTHTGTVDLPNFTGNSGNGAGTATAHNNLQPYVVLNYMIRAI